MKKLLVLISLVLMSLLAVTAQAQARTCESKVGQQVTIRANVRIYDNSARQPGDKNIGATTQPAIINVAGCEGTSVSWTNLDGKTLWVDFAQTDDTATIPDALARDVMKYPMADRELANEALVSSTISTLLPDGNIVPGTDLSKIKVISGSNSESIGILFSDSDSVTLEDPSVIGTVNFKGGVWINMVWVLATSTYQNRSTATYNPPTSNYTLALELSKLPDATLVNIIALYPNGIHKLVASGATQKDKSGVSRLEGGFETELFEQGLNNAPAGFLIQVNLPSDGQALWNQLPSFDSIWEGNWVNYRAGDHFQQAGG